MSSLFDGDSEPEILESEPRGRTASLLGRVPRWAMLAVVAVLLVGGGVALAAGPGRQGVPRSRPVTAVRVMNIPAPCPRAGDSASSGPLSAQPVEPSDIDVPPGSAGAQSVVQETLSVSSGPAQYRPKGRVVIWVTIQGAGHSRRCYLRAGKTAP